MTTIREWLLNERLGLASRLANLSPAEWETPSLCQGWSVRHVAAHLVTPFAVRPSQMAVRVVKARGTSGAMDAAAQALAERPTQALVSLLEAHAGSTFHPPGLPLAAPLTDVIVHGADIRWVLGDGTTDWADPARLRSVLDFLVSRRALAGFMPRGRTRGLLLVAQDQEWSFGSGDEVRGPSLALALALLGRAPALPLLHGSGVAALRVQV
ncbi:MAG: maleylpyruvate isomerase family mycothiol-dependent enzyme [Mycobacteriales bacterium]